MNLTTYQEKPVEPKKVQAFQFKRGQEAGVCFNTRTWFNQNWIYSEDLSLEEFERQRKMFRRPKKDLVPYMVINEQRVRVKHNDWVVVKENNQIDVISTKRFKELYQEIG
jgi:hypothetical protein